MKVPHDAAKRRMPLRLRDERPFTVAPRAIDRLAITVGPDEFGETRWPWIYHLSVAVREQTGRSLDLGRFVLAEPVQDELIFGTIDTPGTVFDRQCVHANAARAARAAREARADGILSPALTGLVNGLRERGFA
jgi:hypothetical protein